MEEEASELSEGVRFQEVRWERKKSRGSKGKARAKAQRREMEDLAPGAARGPPGDLGMWLRTEGD